MEDPALFSRTTLALFALAVPACAELAGLDEYNVREDGGAQAYRACGGPLLWSQSCADCITANPDACDPMQACSDDAICAAFTACLDSCGLSKGKRPWCWVACRADHAAGDNAYFPEWASPLASSGCFYRSRPDGPPSACAGGESWDCSGQYDWPAPKESTARLRVQLNESGDTSFKNLTAKVCGILDPDCTASLAESEASTAADGYTEILDAPTGRIWLELTTDEPRTILFYPGRPILGDEQFTLFVSSVLDGMAGLKAAGVTPEPEKAVVMVQAVFDCIGANPSGVTLSELPGLVQPLYTRGVITSDTTTGPAVSPVVFPNVEPGSTTVEVYRQGGGEVVASDTVFARAGSLTLLYQWPKTVTRF